MKTRPKIIETEDELRREAADKAEVDEQVRAAVEVMFARGIISIKPSDIADEILSNMGDTTGLPPLILAAAHSTLCERAEIYCETDDRLMPAAPRPDDDPLPL